MATSKPIPARPVCQSKPSRENGRKDWGAATVGGGSLTNDFAVEVAPDALGATEPRRRRELIAEPDMGMYEIVPAGLCARQ